MPLVGPMQISGARHNVAAHVQVTVPPHAAGTGMHPYARSFSHRLSKPVGCVPDGQTPASLALMMAPPSVPLATQMKPEVQDGEQVIPPSVPEFPPLPTVPPLPAPPFPPPPELPP